MAKRPGGAMIQSDTPTRSQLIPVLSKWQDIGKKSELAPMLVTILTVILLFVFIDSKVFGIDWAYVTGEKNDMVAYGTIWTSWYLITICIYLMLLSLYFIRRLAGKDKSWLLLIGVMFFTGYLLYLFQTEGDFHWMYQFFHGKLAGGEIEQGDETTQVFVKHFLGTGFFEETFKAVPLFIIAIASAYLPAGLRSKFGIEEPLDGILLGAASGGGFAFSETIGQYISNDLVRDWKIASAVTVNNVPNNADAINAWLAKHAKQMPLIIQQGRDALGWYPGLSVLIPRSLGEAFGHMAYAGCFGYFIGLAVMKPQERIKILAIGLVSASLLHALWDTMASSNLAMILIAILSYAVLAAGILKAREISPNRATLLPSIFIGSLSPTASVVAAYAGGGVAGVGVAAVPPSGAGFMAVGSGGAGNGSSTPPPPKPRAIPGPNPFPAGTASLRVGTKYLVIVAGLRLMAHQVPGLLSGSTEGLVAEITRNPNDPNVLGLTNLSTTSWEVVTSSNTRRDIAPGQTVKLASGTKIDFGETDGEVR
jgi:RsiW-degrading membrane proteinase PrsW (M82 family)